MLKGRHVTNLMVEDAMSLVGYQYKITLNIFMLLLRKT